MVGPNGPIGPNRGPVSIGPQGPTGSQVQPAPQTTGQYRQDIQDRAGKIYYVSETELMQLEEGTEATKRTYLGIAIGAAVAFGVVFWTVTLGPSKHEFFLWGFIASLVMTVYFWQDARKARTLTKRIIELIRRQEEGDELGPSPRRTLREWWRERRAPSGRL